MSSSSANTIRMAMEMARALCEARGLDLASHEAQVHLLLATTCPAMGLPLPHVRLLLDLWDFCLDQPDLPPIAHASHHAAALFLAADRQLSESPTSPEELLPLFGASGEASDASALPDLGGMLTRFQSRTRDELEAQSARIPEIHGLSSSDALALRALPRGTHTLTFERVAMEDVPADAPLPAERDQFDAVILAIDSRRPDQVCRVQMWRDGAEEQVHAHMLGSFIALAILAPKHLTPTLPAQINALTREDAAWLTALFAALSLPMRCGYPSLARVHHDDSQSPS